MIVLFKRKKIILDCFTANGSAYEYAKPDRALNFIPDWWKQIPKVDTEVVYPKTSMRRCAGFIEYFKTGIALPLWSDFNILVGKSGTETYSWQYSDKVSKAEHHPFDQTGNIFNKTEHIHLKLVNPWVFKSNKDVSWLFTPFGWNKFDFEKINIPPGVLNFYHQSSCNINIIFKRAEENALVKLQFNQPLAHLAPLSESEFELRHHLISPIEFDQRTIGSGPITFINSYYEKVKFNKSKEKNT